MDPLYEDALLLIGHMESVFKQSDEAMGELLVMQQAISGECLDILPHMQAVTLPLIYFLVLMVIDGGEASKFCDPIVVELLQEVKDSISMLALRSSQAWCNHLHP